ncbi:hypothetical protein PARMER_00192 [Parabacteroides merdae ATCC 43184]|nr:hypothetical protein PARMER_00192 [Parabacteroides merdae ATCC 43184]
MNINYFQRFTLSPKKSQFGFKRRKEGFSHFRSFRFSFVHPVPLLSF